MYSLTGDLTVNVVLGDQKGREWPITAKLSSKNSFCLLNTYCVLETILNVLHVLIHLTLPTTRWESIVLMFITHTMKLMYRDKVIICSRSHSWEVVIPRFKPKLSGYTVLVFNFYPVLPLKSVSIINKR